MRIHSAPFRGPSKSTAGKWSGWTRPTEIRSRQLVQQRDNSGSGIRRAASVVSDGRRQYFDGQSCVEVLIRDSENRGAGGSCQHSCSACRRWYCVLRDCGNRLAFPRPATPHRIVSLENPPNQRRSRCCYPVVNPDRTRAFVPRLLKVTPQCSPA